MNINDVLYLIQNSNLKTNTKSFLSTILKDVENADTDSSEDAKRKAEEDSAWSQRAQQKDAKKLLEEDAAYDYVESPYTFNTYPDFERRTVNRMTPDEGVARDADSSDVERLNKKNALRQQVMATPGRVDPKTARLENDKASFRRQADEMYEYYSPVMTPEQVERFDGDPRVALDNVDGPDEEDLRMQNFMRRVNEAEKRNSFEKLLDDIRAKR